MHVLMTTDTVGGVWVYTRELVTALARRGIQVTLVSFGEFPSKEQTAWLSGLPGVDFYPTAFRLEWMQDCEADLKASAVYLRDLIRRVKPELLHFNQYCYGSLPCDIPRVVVAHSDVLSWWAEVHGQLPCNDPWIRNYRELVIRGVWGATAVVAPSRWMLEQLYLRYARPRRWVVICNGRSPGSFDPSASKENYVVSIGRLWDCAKQLDLLADCELPLKSVIVGTAVHPDPAYRLAREGQRSENVQIVGPQSLEQISQILSRAAIYAATSRYEPFGLALVEAALSRCAIVANDISTFRELWGDTVCYFQKNNAASLASTIKRVYDDPALYRSYADRAYERACQRFSADRMVDEYLALYGALTSAGAAAA